jgi:hypothetical protein
MASLGEHLLINYECYAKARQGSWLKIHKLYNIARAEGVHDTTVESDSGPARTVEHIYKRLLLLGLSDPYRYPFRGLGRIYENLEEWASLASLTTTAENSGRCLFTWIPPWTGQRCRLCREAVSAPRSTKNGWSPASWWTSSSRNMRRPSRTRR